MSISSTAARVRSDCSLLLRNNVLVGFSFLFFAISLFVFGSNANAQQPKHMQQANPPGASLGSNGIAVPPGQGGGYQGGGYQGGGYQGGGYQGGGYQGGGYQGGGYQGGGYQGGGYQSGGYSPGVASVCVTQTGACATGGYIGSPCACSDGYYNYYGVAQ